MNDEPTTDALVDFLRRVRTIAVVGLSTKPDRPSHRVALYMQRQGYRIVPVRPGARELLGEVCYPSLDAIPAEVKIDLVDVFRPGEDTPPVAEAAVRIGAGGLWLQSGIRNDDAMATARAGGLFAIQDHCLMVVHRELADRL